MTYYDRINNTLTEFVIIPNISKITSNYLFTYGNKYIVDLKQKQVINKKFPKEFYETSFSNQFVLCESIQNTKKIYKDIDDCIDGIICKTTNKYHNLKMLNKCNDSNIPGGCFIDIFMKEYKSTIKDWCVFLEIFHKMYWLININKKSNFHGQIIFIYLSDKFSFYPERVCNNILEFENMFYKIIEEIHISEKYSDSRKESYGKNFINEEHYDYDGRNYAFEQIKEQQTYIL